MRIRMLAAVAILGSAAFVYGLSKGDAEQRRLTSEYGLGPHQAELMKDCSASMHELGARFEERHVGVERGCACVAAEVGKAAGYGQFKAAAAALHFLMRPSKPREETLARAARRFSVAPELAQTQIEIGLAAINYCADKSHHPRNLAGASADK